jgi:hypothetical protein
MKEMARDLTSSAAAFPASPKDLLRSPVFSQLWYYAMELLPGVRDAWVSALEFRSHKNPAQPN